MTQSFPIWSKQTPAFAAVLAASLAAAPALANPKGQEIYRAQCARCHGVNGEGDEKRYPHPLIGDRSPAQLASLIGETMPPTDPDLCVAEDALAVSEYIHDAFYSPVARARNKPPRIELARLTVAQYLNSVADLVGGMRGAVAKVPESKGLRGQYFSSRRFRDNERGLDRVDPVIAFDFGEKSPAPGKLPDNEFAVRWEGSVFAPETGRYEFIIRAQNGARLWVNDRREPLIDASVRSGDLERRGNIFLIGGRSYPLRLEMFKSERGKETTAAITLAWEPPAEVADLKPGTAEPIPARYLSPEVVPETLVVNTPFPPDDRSLGWVRGTAVSREWDAAVTRAAIEVSGFVSDNLNELAGRDASKYREFAARFAERAFRKPLSDEQRRVVNAQFEASPDAKVAVKRVVLLSLLSPRFLYREVGAGPSDFDVANRLSFGLWDSIPDRELWEAASAGRLSTREQVVAQAERMVADPRAKAKLTDFFRHWLKTDHALDLAKDSEQYPDFEPSLFADLRTSLELFIDEVVWDEASDFRRLLRDDSLYLNGKLAKIYGVDLPPDADFQKVKTQGDRRAGLLTHPYLMAGFAYTADTSPIHRGVFVARGLLGVGLRPPPEAITPLPADLHPGLTTRERVVLQTSEAACVSCHAVINPLGFTMEHYDAIGRFRETDNGKPIDASGYYETRDGRIVRFADAGDLAEYLAESQDTHAAFAEQLFHHLVQQPVMAYGTDALEEFRDSFAGSGFHIRKLAVEIMARTALTPRSVAAAGN